MLTLKQIAMVCVLLGASSLATAGRDAAKPFSALGIGLGISAKNNANSEKPVKSKPQKKSSGGKVSFHNGSGESTPERERRLKRECKGRSNSGLCEGFTR